MLDLISIHGTSVGRAPRVAAKELSLQPEVSGRRAYVAACNTHNDDWTRVHSGTFGIESYEIEVDKVNVAKTKRAISIVCAASSGLSRMAKQDGSYSQSTTS